jgi:hypothetical protein
MMNEEGEVMEGTPEGVAPANGGVASIDAGGPNLGGVFKTGDMVEFNNMTFRVTMAEGAMMTIQFIGFTQNANVGGVS